MVIRWWGFHFARTGDAESLDWAQRMADKWLAAQDPETGLISHWFGSQIEGEPEQPPRPFTNQGDSMTAVELLRASKELRKRAGGEALADQTERMGRNLLAGLAKHGYLRDEGIFPEWIDLDGRVRRETTFYHFANQADKDEAVKQDPTLENVDVYLGSGYYTSGPSAIGVHNSLPRDIAQGAAMTGDAELTERARIFAGDLLEDAAKLTSEFNAAGQWTYPASASYISALVRLHEATGEDQYLAGAKQIADRELELLGQPVPEGTAEWWRQPFRNSILEAMLDLHRASVPAAARAS
jgi:hypothetical protein